MSGLTFKLSTARAREAAMRAVFQAGVSLDDPLTVTIKRERSKAQNSTFHGWCGIIAIEHGNSQEAVKEFLKGKFLPPAKVEEVKGVEVLIPPSTASLSKSEMQDFMTQVEAWAAEWGVALPAPEEMHLEGRAA